MSRFQDFIISISVVLAMLVMLCGCVPSLTPFEQKSLQAQRDAAATQTETLKEQQDKAMQVLQQTLKENAAKGIGSPVSNPIDATNNTVRELHPWLFYGSISLFIIAVLCLGLSAIGPSAASIPWLSWLKPIGDIAQVFEPVSVRCFCLTFSALMLLPFIRASVILAIISLAILFIYEMVINKGNFKAVLSSVVKVVTGLGSPAAESVVSASIK